MAGKTLIQLAMACGWFASAVNAHMVINSPVPYGKDTLNNSPLENDGSDFPCKKREGVYEISHMNDMPVGVPQTLSFMGGATHGGGSCQVSVTLDQQPDENSDWKVIHSIIGGCPSNVTGNLSDDADGTDASVFSFSIPKGMPNGVYTLAWTWFNKIGNREMYMNCAPITVTGGADNNDVLDTLPTMWVMNIPNEECESVEGEDFVFPSPGLYAETPFSTALGSSTQGSGCSSMTNKGAGDGSLGSAVTATSAAGSSESVAPTASGSVAASITSVGVPQTSPATSGVIATSTVMSTITSTTFTVSAPTASSTGAPVSPPSEGTGSSSTGTCAEGSVQCSNPGGVVCIGSAQFGLCDMNSCAVVQDLATGTSCANGAISKRHLSRHIHGLKHAMLF